MKALPEGDRISACQPAAADRSVELWRRIVRGTECAVRTLSSIS